MKECINCGPTDKYYAKGMCKSCYMKKVWNRLYKNNIEYKLGASIRSRRSYLKNKDKIVEKRKSVKDSNPDSWKDYYRTAQQKYRDRLRSEGKNSRDVYLFSNMREDVYKRDNYMCVNCGITQKKYLKLGFGRMPIHHIDSSGFGKSVKEKNNDINNLVTLCNVCHCKETQRILHGHKPRTLEEFKS